MKLDEIRQGAGQWMESLSEGWQRLRRGAADALTRFKPGEKTQLPARSEVDDGVFWPPLGWSMLGGDVFEDEHRVLVRLEAPGLEKDDFDIQVLGRELTVRGEKRFEREAGAGRWRTLQCAYGSFVRRVALPAEVRGDEARATYKAGVLRIELPKRHAEAPVRRTIAVG